MRADQMVSWLANLGLKGMLLLTAAALLTRFMKNRSAAARHKVASLATAGLILLPLFSLVLPWWQVSLLPEWARHPSSISIAPADGSWFQQNTPVRYFRAMLSFEALVRAAGPMMSETTNGWWNLFVTARWTRWLLPIWAIGAIAVMIPWLAGMWIISRRRKNTRGTLDIGVAVMFRALRGDLGIRRPVELKISEDSSIPITYGVFRPCVILPADAESWPSDRLRSVLLHELFHVVRWDCATQLMGQLMCALYWFNPLAWLMARSMRAEHERACDDRVLAWGLGEASYAEHLVQIARSLCAPRRSWLPAVAFSKPSQLRDRLIAILDPHRSRRIMGMRGTLIAAAMMLAVVTPLAMLHAADPATAQAASIPRLPGSVLLVTDGNFFLDRALASIPSLGLTTITPADYDRNGAGSARLVIFDRYAPAMSPNVPSIFFGAIPNEESTQTNGTTLTDATMSIVDADHPLIKGLDLSRVNIALLLAMNTPAGANVLVSDQGKPLVLLTGSPKRQLVVAFDLSQSNWPLRPTFPIFVERAVQQMLGSAAQ